MALPYLTKSHQNSWSQVMKKEESTALNITGESNNSTVVYVNHDRRNRKNQVFMLLLEASAPVKYCSKDFIPSLPAITNGTSTSRHPHGHEVYKGKVILAPTIIYFASSALEELSTEKGVKEFCAGSSEYNDQDSLVIEPALDPMIPESQLSNDGIHFQNEKIVPPPTQSRRFLSIHGFQESFFAGRLSELFMNEDPTAPNDSSAFGTIGLVGLAVVILVYNIYYYKRRRTAIAAVKARALQYGGTSVSSNSRKSLTELQDYYNTLGFIDDDDDGSELLVFDDDDNNYGYNNYYYNYNNRPPVERQLFTDTPSLSLSERLMSASPISLKKKSQKKTSNRENGIRSSSDYSNQRQRVEVIMPTPHAGSSSLGYGRKKGKNNSRNKAGKNVMDNLWGGRRGGSSPASDSCDTKESSAADSSTYFKSPPSSSASRSRDISADEYLSLLQERGKNRIGRKGNTNDDSSTHSNSKSNHFVPIWDQIKTYDSDIVPSNDGNDSQQECDVSLTHSQGSVRSERSFTSFTQSQSSVRAERSFTSFTHSQGSLRSERSIEGSQDNKNNDKSIFRNVKKKLKSPKGKNENKTDTLAMDSDSNSISSRNSIKKKKKRTNKTNPVVDNKTDNNSSRSEKGGDTLQSVRRKFDDLDAMIEAGNWEAVAEFGDMFAKSLSKDQSETESGRSTPSALLTTPSEVVDTGRNWEGVVSVDTTNLQFGHESSTNSSATNWEGLTSLDDVSSHGDSSSMAVQSPFVWNNPKIILDDDYSSTRSGGLSSRYSSVGSMYAESGYGGSSIYGGSSAGDYGGGFSEASVKKASSRANRQSNEKEEFREQVRALLQSSMPDQVSQLDSMIEEFKDRESELLLTLQAYGGM